LSPVDLYDTVTFGYFFRKPFSTASNDFCSSPVQTPTIETLPLIDDGLVVVAGGCVVPDELLLPPHADSNAAIATSKMDATGTRSGTASSSPVRATSNRV